MDGVMLADVRPGDKIASYPAPCNVSSAVRYTIRGRAVPGHTWPNTFMAEADGPDILVVWEQGGAAMSWPMVWPADIAVRLV